MRTETEVEMTSLGPLAEAAGGLRHLLQIGLQKIGADLVPVERHR